MIAQIGTEVDADKAKWGVTFGSFRYFQAEMNMLIKNYLVPKRNTLYITHGPSGTGLLPEAQVGNPVIVLRDYQVNPGANIINDPAISPQECEYVELENPNSYAVDISGWKLTGGVEFTFKPGTVIASHSSLYVCPNVKAFLMRNESPKGGEGLFVVGDYDGHLSNWGETVNLLAADGAMIYTFSYAANPSDQQRYLRISEMMYHPSTPDGVTAFEDEDFEYIELKNIGTESLSLVGVRLTDGASYAFPLTSSYSEKLDLLDYTDAWKYDQTDTDLKVSWRQSGYDDAGWLSGAGLLYVKPSDLPEPKNTLLMLGPRTFYFRTHFNFPSAPSVYESVELKLSTILDDGAVVYLNGQEVFRLGVSEGQTHSSLSSRLVGDAVVEGPFVIPSDNLVQGDNILAVEVHQQSDSSSDVVWGCQLQAIVTIQTAGQTLQPEQHLVICKNAEAFAERYDLTGILIADGNYTGNLSNSGEMINLEDMTGSTIQSFSYKDGWYPVTDGGGFSLTVIDTTAANDLSKKSSWKPSSTLGGSPGQADTGSIPLPGSIVINELLAHSHDVAPDWIELYNTTDQPINIGGWYIGDSGSTDEALMKYQIPLGTIIPAYGFAVFYEETDFTDFAFSVNGETAYLTSAVDGQLGSYRISESFSASPTGIAFGRYYKASTDSYNFVLMSTNTPGAANAYPLVGPLVISEIMYHPPQLKDAEYVELLNISNETVHLYDVAKGAGWKFADDGGFEFYFPADSAIAPGERILIVKNPVAFASEFTAAAGTQIFAWSGDGNLSNSGEEIQLSMPGDIDSEGTRYYIRIDRVVYSDGSHPEDADPWPVAADGNGQSLHRIDHNAYGNDVLNWTAAAPTPVM
ncbi:MAG: lamin tail domain-containing protein [Sedimentisphaerales bacterium]|nr:lamin tail domain-containing protein [Sedimentisphaerales bacterium]